MSAVHMDIDIHVWAIDLRRAADDAALSADERARAARLVMPDARRRLVAARTGLREILARITGVDAAALTFGAGEYGKPYLTGMDDAPYFNLAHSGELALIAVSSEQVGIDVEHIRPVTNMSQMAEMSFTDEEHAALLAMDKDARSDAFFHLWTHKEAVMKAHGAGFRLAKSFSLPLTATVGDDRTPYMASVQLGEILYQVRDIDVASGFVAAVAVEINSANDQLRIQHHSL